MLRKKASLGPVFRFGRELQLHLGLVASRRPRAKVLLSVCSGVTQVRQLYDGLAGDLDDGLCPHRDALIVLGARRAEGGNARRHGLEELARARVRSDGAALVLDVALG